ncbi:MAG: alpha/beta hydrolase [Actinobacteria bacterium]|nr:alpha/beta hydrolase [Actinomycetota bacterium]
MSRFLLVPGGWHGAWAYDEVLPGLRGAGHAADAVTLAGLGPGPAAGRAGAINLETHVDDVVRALGARPEPAILGAHSYGGMAIEAATRPTPGLVAGLVYIDAYVPVDGDSCWSLTTGRFRRMMVRNTGADGLAVAPSRSDDPRARPHPLACFVQRIRLPEGGAVSVPRDFVYLSGWEETPFAALAEGLRGDPAWHVWELTRGHNLALEHPEELVELLLAIAARHGAPGTRGR